jgi:hypothetical protein
MSAFLELVAAATPGAIFVNGVPLRDKADLERFHARCSPDTMKRVYEALKEAKGLAEIVGPGEDEDIATVHGLEQHVAQITEALALLDGQPDAQGGGR